MRTVTRFFEWGAPGGASAVLGGGSGRGMCPLLCPAGGEIFENIHLYVLRYQDCPLILPRCACASEVYGSVFVCVSVCPCRLLQLLRDQRSASKSFYRLVVTFSWISIRGFAKQSFVLELWLLLLTWKACHENFGPPKISVHGSKFSVPRTNFAENISLPLKKMVLQYSNIVQLAEEITCSFTMEPEHEPDTGEDQLVDEVFQYMYITTRKYPDYCKEGRRRVIRRKAKQFEVDNSDLMYTQEKAE